MAVQRGMRWMAVALAVIMAAAACSVSTPRDGVSTGAASAVPASDAPVSGVEAGADTAEVGPLDVAAEQSATAAPSGPAPASTPGTPGAADTPATGGTAAPVAPARRGNTTGLTGDSITISVLAGFSGSYGSLFKLLADNGYGLWADEVNAGGGIHGRKIKLKMVDNHDTAEGGVAACKEVQSNGSFMAISLAGLGGADLSSSECLDRAGIPMFALNLAGYRSTWKHVISMNDDGKQAAPLASFIKNVIGDGAGKVGMIVVNDPVHLEARAQVAKDLKRLGMKHVRDEIISVGQGTFVAELSRLRNAGATTVALLTGNEAIGIARDAKAMGYEPNFTGVLWTIDEFSQAAGSLWSGIKAIRVWPTTDSAAYRTYVAKARKYQRDSLVNTTVMAVYGGGVVLSDILRSAGAGLAREGVAPAAEALVGYDNGIIALSFGPGKRVADIKAFPLVCCNGDNTWKGTGPARLEF